jgi:hypothetical protein
MTTYVLTSKFVSDGAIAARGGRIFVAFKPPGAQRNTLYEVKLSGTSALLTAIGNTPGTYYKDGNCSLAFDDASGELLMLNFCSPNPATGGDAVPVLWTTGIVVAGGGGTVDSVARQLIAGHELRLDRIAAGAAG